MDISIHQAIRSLNPSAKYVSSSDDGVTFSYDWLDGTTPISDEEIQAERVRLQAEYDAKLYQRKRATEYPSIGDQLDALFHAGVFPEEMAAKIQAVKDAHPKPE